MIAEDKVIVFDIDGTLCPIKKEGETYEDLLPYPEILKKLKQYKDDGFYIILHSSRNMRTFQGNIGQLNAITMRSLFAWLEYNQIPFDEIVLGKPWAGKRGFYVDDKAIRPQEFLSKSYDEIKSLLGAGY